MKKAIVVSIFIILILSFALYWIFHPSSSAITVNIKVTQDANPLEGWTVDIFVTHLTYEEVLKLPKFEGHGLVLQAFTDEEGMVSFTMPLTYWNANLWVDTWTIGHDLTREWFPNAVNSLNIQLEVEA